MKNEELYIRKLMKIKKIFKRDKMYLELYLSNYEGYYLYFVINYINKTKNYKLSWFDLDRLDEKKIKQRINYIYIPDEIIDEINESLKNSIIPEKIADSNKKKNLVTLNVNTKTKNSKSVNLNFNSYLPLSLSNLLQIIIFLYYNLPTKYHELFDKLLSEFNGTKKLYEYKEEFNFDLFNDDINSIFSPVIITRGTKYYEENRIIFLEKINEKYYAVIEGKEKYVIVIKYNELDNIMQVYCSCPCDFYCKHICAVILSIRNNEFKRFYKVYYSNNNKDLYERVLNFDYKLCLGIEYESLELLTNDGKIEFVPILDINNKCNWTVLEDTEDEELTKKIQYVIDNKKNI